MFVFPNGKLHCPRSKALCAASPNTRRLRHGTSQMNGRPGQWQAVCPCRCHGCSISQTRVGIADAKHLIKSRSLTPRRRRSQGAFSFLARYAGTAWLRYLLISKQSLSHRMLRSCPPCLVLLIHPVVKGTGEHVGRNRRNKQNECQSAPANDMGGSRRAHKQVPGPSLQQAARLEN
jgi:hypothetical protein